MFWGFVVMVKSGGLSCGCSRTRGTLEAVYEGRRVGLLCEDCALDLYSLRAFVISARWLYRGRQLHFVPRGPGTAEPLHGRLLAVVDAEARRAREAKDSALIALLSRAVG